MPNFCGNCGTPVLQNVNYCDNCGNVFKENTGITEVSNPPPTAYGMQNRYGTNPYIPPPPPPPHLSPRKGRPGTVEIIIVAVIAMLVIIGGIGAALVLGHSKVATQIVTTQTPTKTATVASTQTTVDPYTHVGTLVLNDPLKDNSLGNGWDEGTYQVGSCVFKSGAYHVSTFLTNSAYSCQASQDFSNFAFEVQMTILKGDQGGITFREGPNGVYDYRFDVVQSGLFELIAEGGATENQGTTTVYKIKTQINLTYSSAIHQGLGQTNIIAVVAQGSTFRLYVNKQQIASVTDNTFSHGTLGLVAAPNATGGHLTEVVYSNAKVWTL